MNRIISGRDRAMARSDMENLERAIREEQRRDTYRYDDHGNWVQRPIESPWAADLNDDVYGPGTRRHLQQDFIDEFEVGSDLHKQIDGCKVIYFKYSEPFMFDGVKYRYCTAYSPTAIRVHRKLIRVLPSDYQRTTFHKEKTLYVNFGNFSREKCDFICRDEMLPAVETTINTINKETCIGCSLQSTCGHPEINQNVLDRKLFEIEEDVNAGREDKPQSS